MHRWKLVARALGVTACVAALALSDASTAHAGPNESFRSLSFHRDDPATFAAVYTEAGGGFLLTHDGGKTFTLSCSSAVYGKRTIRGLVPKVVWTASGGLLVGDFDGLFVGNGSGCGFERVTSFGEAGVYDLVADPDRPSTFYALVSATNEKNGVYRSEDEGATWSPLGALDDGIFRELRIAKLADGTRRFYLSVCRQLPDGSRNECTLRMSEDDGETFTNRIVTKAETLALLGVDRRQPDRVYLAVDYADRYGSFLLQHDWDGDAGKFVELGKALEIGSFEASEEGGFRAVDPQQNLLLTLRDGVLVNEATAVPNLTCLERSPHDGQNYACGVWTVARSDETAMAVEAPFLNMNTVTAFSPCEERDMPAVCREQLLYGWCGQTHYPDAPVCALRSGGGQAPRDAGVGASDASAADRPVPKKSDGCSIAAAEQVAPRWSQLMLAALVACGLVVRRRRAAS